MQQLCFLATLDSPSKSHKCPPRWTITTAFTLNVTLLNASCKFFGVINPVLLSTSAKTEHYTFGSICSG